MLNSVIFRVKLDKISCEDLHALRALLEQIGVAIHAVHPYVAIDPNVELEEEAKAVKCNSVGDSSIEAFLEVKRINGDVEYHKVTGPVVNGVCDGTTVKISKEEYDAHHNTPEAQANLKSAQKVANIH